MSAGSDLCDLDATHLHEDLGSRGVDLWSDVALADAIAGVLGRPRLDPPDSFVLHAPLELLARTALLPWVSPDHRAAARRQMASIAARFDAFGPPMDLAHERHARHEHGSSDPLEAMRSAVLSGDQRGAAIAGFEAGRVLNVAALTQGVADLVAPSLAAAAHASIFLHHLPRAAPRSPLAGAMFGTLAREIARHPDWTLTWMDDRPLSGRGTDLARALAETPILGLPGSSSIRPLMSQAESSGLAADVVGCAVETDTDLDEATRAILRIATASMLLDDPTHAAYGWSHCLTIPQGLLSVAPYAADPTRVIAIAATHVVGFRAGEGCAPLSELADGRLDDAGLLDGLQRPSPDELQRVIDHAATHEDAHLTKYVVSCLDAARLDPVGAAQHLRAAVYLSDWWRDVTPSR